MIQILERILSMKTGEAIEFIRKNKNITLKQVCGTHLSRPNYYRIAHDQVDTSASNLKKILDYLHVSSDEFYYIANNFRQDKLYIDINKLRLLFESNDIRSLENLSQEYNHLKESNQSYSHMYCLIEIFKAKMLHHTNEDCEKILHDYLTNIETWTHYETVLFNNCMFIFSTEFIDIIISKALHNLTRYSSLRSYGSESFRMLINVLILFIDRREFNKANLILSKLEIEPIKNDFLFEKLCLKFFKNIMLLINGTTDNLDEAYKIIDLLIFLDSKGIAEMFSTYLSNIKNQGSVAKF